MGTDRVMGVPAVTFTPTPTSLCAVSNPCSACCPCVPGTNANESILKFRVPSGFSTGTPSR